MLSKRPETKRVNGVMVEAMEPWEEEECRQGAALRGLKVVMGKRHFKRPAQTQAITSGWVARMADNEVV